MRNAYIKFRTAEDHAAGSRRLIAHSPVSRLSNDVYCIPWDSLALLDDQHLDYSFASEDDLTNAQPIWKIAGAR